MRENRTYGSEGGEAENQSAFPTPIGSNMGLRRTYAPARFKGVNVGVR